MRGFRLFAYLRTSGVQAVLIFLQVGERSSSVPPSAPKQVVRFRHLTKHSGSKTAAQTVSNPEVRQHHASFKLNVSLWALEFHLFPSQFGCGCVATVLPAYAPNFLFLFHGSVAASGVILYCWASMVLTFWPHEGGCAAGRDPFCCRTGART